MSRNTVRSSVIALVVLIALPGCGGDSPPLPFEPDPDCPFTICTDGGGIPELVIEPLDDAIARLVPNLGDADARYALNDALVSLRRALRESDVSNARAELASALVHLELAELAAGPDLPDLAAIRLSLVLSAGALGAPLL